MAKASSINQQEMAAQYGWALSVLKSDKELWKLFNTAVKKNYSTARFVASLRNTKWYRRQSDSARKASVLKRADPKTYYQQKDQIKAHVEDVAGSMGIDFPSNQTKDHITHLAQIWGWNDEQIRNRLAMYLDQVGSSGHYGGDAGKAEAELRQYAYNQGVPISDSSLKGWLKNIIAQNQTVEDYKASLQHQAELAFPNLGDKIKAGVTVRDLASPYISQMAQTLELDDASIDMTDPNIRKALQSTGPDGKFESKPMWQFEQELKKDPRWLKTDNARSSLMATGSQILKDFGFST